VILSVSVFKVCAVSIGVWVKERERDGCWRDYVCLAIAKIYVVVLNEESE